MCGICGYIGASNEPQITWRLITALFAKTEVRGEDASGFWGPIGEDRVIYHKEPVKASQFVLGEWWNKVQAFNTDLLVCHARQASYGVGLPSINKNNHPFLSKDRKIALVHNGRIPDVEYKALKKQYPTISNCDSEILLRLFEAGVYAPAEKQQEFQEFDPEVASRLTGMKDIWSFLSLGQMAVAIGETQSQNSRRLWLFRNKHRSLWLADLRKTLGQVFFFSVPQIWKEAVNTFKQEIQPFLAGARLIELPTEEIWLFSISPTQSIAKKSALKRFEVCASGSYTAFDEDKIVCPTPKNIPGIEILTGLGEEDKLPEPPPKQIGVQARLGTANEALAAGTKNTQRYFGSTPRPDVVGAHGKVTPPTNTPASYPMSHDEVNAEAIDALCESLVSLSQQIKTTFNNQLLEGSVDKSGYQDLKQSLEQIELDLTGTLHISERVPV